MRAQARTRTQAGTMWPSKRAVRYIIDPLEIRRSSGLILSSSEAIMESGEMEIDNGITERERAEVIAAIEAIAEKDRQRLEDASTRSGFLFAQGLRCADEEILNYLKKRWQC